MGDCTKNLSAYEMACRCKYEDCNLKKVAHMPLMVLIQEAGDYFQEKYNATALSISITGPNRCRKHNEDEGGAAASPHIDGIAADHRIKVKINGEWVTISAEELALYYDKRYPTSHGVGIYPRGRVQLDTRADGFPRRWPQETWKTIKE